MSTSNFTKKALALLISAALLTGLAACGSDDSKEKNTKKNTSRTPG